MKEKTGQKKGRGVQKALEEQGENSGEPSIVSGGRSVTSRVEMLVDGNPARAYVLMKYMKFSFKINPSMNELNSLTVAY